MAPMQIAAVILAAGASRRFGSPKQLVRIGGRTMLELVADTARRAGLDPIVAVVPPAVAVPAGVVARWNDAPAEGLSRSLWLGLDAVPAGIDGAIILLGDQPGVSTDTLLRLVAAGAGDRSLAAASAAGRVGPPVLLRREAFGLAREAVGDEGLRSVLGRNRDLVTTVPVQAHAADVDTVADLHALTEACPGCRAVFWPLRDGPVHDYIGASAPCWAAFGRLMALEFGEASYRSVHRNTVDAYAAQHPGVDGPRQRQSVPVHLVGLCHWLEHGLATAALSPITRRLAAERREWPWLDPPAAYELTVLDVLQARSAGEHASLVRAWGEAVWRSWSAHHEIVRRWSREALASPARR